MRPERTAAERAAEVRNAAAGWLAAGFVDAPAADTISSLYPDDRQRVGIAFRVLLAAFSAFAGLAALGLGAMVFESVVPACVLAPVLALAVEWLTGPGRRAGGGLEEGLSFAALASGVVAMAWLGDDLLGLHNQGLLRFALAGAAALAAAAVWRWGMPAYAGASAACLFLLLATIQGGRWLALGLALALTPLLSHLRGDTRLAPSHRAAMDLALVVSLAAAYLAINYCSVAERWFEHVANDMGQAGEPALLVRLAAIAGTALLPLAVLGRGVTARDRLLLWCGALMVAASGMTLRVYVHLAPAWLLLMAIGLALLGLAALLDRYLDRGPEGERAGFTARALTPGTDLRKAVEIVGTLASLTPQAPASPPEPGFKGEGGRFGGGGASESF